MSKIALVDLDGTVADYDAAMERDLAPLRSPEETGPVVERGKASWTDHFKARVQLVRSQNGWWENLGRLEDGFRGAWLACLGPKPGLSPDRYGAPDRIGEAGSQIEEGSDPIRELGGSARQSSFDPARV